MTEEQFKNEIKNFLARVNYYAYNDYKQYLSEETLYYIQNFSANNIKFFNDSNDIDKSNEHNIYINTDRFKKIDNFDSNKLLEFKNDIISVYLKKYVLLEKEKMKHPEKFSDSEIDNFLIRHNIELNYEFEEKKEKNIQEEKEIVAKSYGVDIRNIDTITINDHRYYKFNKDGKPKMIETLEDSTVLSEFKDNQDNNVEYQTNDSLENANKIQNKIENEKININLININDIVNYENYINSLSLEQRKCIVHIYKNRKNINAAYINLENGIIINDNGECLFAEKNENTGEFEIKTANTSNYNEIENKNNQKENNENFIDNNINTSNSDENNDEKNNENENNDENTYNDTKDYQNTKNKQKILTLNDNNRGYTNVLILSLITSFVSGFLFALLIFLMKK